MTVKKILALPIGTETDAAVIRTAFGVARNFGAHVSVVYAGGWFPPIYFAAYDSASVGFGNDQLAEIEQEDLDKENAVRVCFDEFVRDQGIMIRETPANTEEATASWRSTKGPASHFVAGHGGAFDLIVIARSPDPTSSATQIAAETALFSTGRPVLIVPPEPPSAFGKTVLIGWNRSAQSARAFHAARALLLERAEKVHILSVTTGAKEGPSAEEIADTLAWHGVEAEIRELEPDRRPVGEVVLAEAQAVGADLVVMGAYSHSRLRQMILGGVTRHILANTSVPVFMAH